MNKLLLYIGLIVSLTACSLFENKEKKAIEICQKAKVQFQTDNAFANLILNVYGLGNNASWLDFANMIAKQDPNKKYDWHAKKTGDNKYYIVDFTDPDGWGYRWEVDIEQQIIKSIGQNEYLSRKYGLSRFGGNDKFEVTDIEQSELKIDKQYSYWDGNSSNIVYIIKAVVMNKTNKTITTANIDGKLKLIFQDKTITGEGNYESGFKTKISEKRPWEPNTTRQFYIKTKGIEKIYLNYIPEYVVFDISLKAEDPVGYSFDKDIADMDLKKNWKAFKDNNPTNNSSDQETKKSKSTYKETKNEHNTNSDDHSKEEDTTSNENE